MTVFSFLHAADIHLDSPLRGLSRYEGVPAEEMRLATRSALDHLVDFAIEEQVAFLVIAGDLYDGNWQDFSTGLHFCRAMGRLGQAGIDVFLLFGNHDAESAITKKLPLPANVKAFGTRKPETFLHEPTGSALHGWSYRDKVVTENLVAKYPAAVEGRFNIGVLHTALSGRPPHAPYAPCSINDLLARNYDYWALGHAHQFELVHPDPPIVYPGNLQGRNVRECGAKGAVLISVAEGRVVGPPHPIALDSMRWAQVEIDISEIGSEAELTGKLREALIATYDREANGRPLMTRVRIAGKTPLHGPLCARRATLREDVRAIAIAISDRLWIEKVVPATRPVDAAGGEGGKHDELALLLAQGCDDPALADGLNAELAEFLARIPPDLSSEDDLIVALRRGDVAPALREAAEALSAQFETELG